MRDLMSIVGGFLFVTLVVLAGIPIAIYLFLMLVKWVLMSLQWMGAL